MLLMSSHPPLQRTKSKVANIVYYSALGFYDLHACSRADFCSTDMLQFGFSGVLMGVVDKFTGHSMLTFVPLLTDIFLSGP